MLLVHKEKPVRLEPLVLKALRAFKVPLVRWGLLVLPAPKGPEDRKDMLVQPVRRAYRESKALSARRV